MGTPGASAWLALGLGLGAAATGSAVGAMPKLRGVDDRHPPARRLFITDEHVEQMHNLRRVLNQPSKHPGNPVLRPERPWETAFVHNYGTMLFDEKEQLFKFWHLAGPRIEPGQTVTVDGHRHAKWGCFCLSTSRDGFHWERPSLGQVSFEGSKDNNILLLHGWEGLAIVHEPDDPNAGRRYKAFFQRDGMSVAFSRDGIHWTPYEGNPILPCHSDTGHYIVRDPQTDLYVAFGRFGFGRKIARTTSPDFVTWSKPQLVLEPDEHERSGPWPATQFYGMTVDLYEGLYIGGLWVYRQGTDGKIDTQLAVSRDGIHWQRVADRRTFLPLSPEGSWDDGMIRPAARFITRGERVFIFHGMVNAPHRGPKFADPVRKFPGALGLSIMRRDGFVSLDTGDEAGFVDTKPVSLDGRALHLNIDVRDGGEAKVMADGVESHPVRGDHTDIRVAWPQGGWTSLASRKLNLRIEMRRAKLYSFWLGDAG